MYKILPDLAAETESTRENSKYIGNRNVLTKKKLIKHKQSIILVEKEENNQNKKWICKHTYNFSVKKILFVIKSVNYIYIFCVWIIKSTTTTETETTAKKQINFCFISAFFAI